MKSLVSTVILAGLVLAADSPRRSGRAKDRYFPIARGAIKVPLPEVQQPDDYSCGVAALMSVTSYFGVGTEDFDKLKRDLGTKDGFGTSVYRMEAYARDRLRLEVTLFKDQTGPATRRLLKKALDDGKPVICSIQAWADNQAVYADPKRNQDGHYVVAIGYDDENNFYFMDPSLTGRRGVLPWNELDRRWHENEAPGRKKDIHHHLGIVVGPGGHRVAYFSRARRID